RRFPECAPYLTKAINPAWQAVLGALLFRIMGMQPSGKRWWIASGDYCLHDEEQPPDRRSRIRSLFRHENESRLVGGCRDTTPFTHQG
ncbi:hypothetical protein D6779_07910, partial [Candidatus Parcubacteria bacterium]